MVIISPHRLGNRHPVRRRTGRHVNRRSFSPAKSQRVANSGLSAIAPQLLELQPPTVGLFNPTKRSITHGLFSRTGHKLGGLFASNLLLAIAWMGVPAALIREALAFDDDGTFTATVILIVLAITVGISFIYHKFRYATLFSAIATFGAATILITHMGLEAAVYYVLYW